MRLFIAEKPELAKAIVAGLGGGQRKEGYFDCGHDQVTWCFGHMLSLYDPEDYDEKYKKWTVDHLPIVHVPWQKKVSSDKGKQVKVIKTLLKNASSVVHAGDPDEEGQLLVDELLDHLHCRVPVQRVLINDNNTKVVKKALNQLKDNKEFAGLSASAEARSVADQLYGYNMTRLYTLFAQQKGLQTVLSVGRVQTPILGLVIRRDQQHAAHQKSLFYVVKGQFNFSGLCVNAKYQTKETDPIDEKNRLIDKRFAEQLAQSITGQPASVVDSQTQQKKQPAPLPYNLLKLQADASRKFGIKPAATLEITQSLRECHQLITYNRSDCEYLSDEQHSDAPAVLDAIAVNAPALNKAAQAADSSLTSRAFNSSKVSAHHAIIPTEVKADFNQLSDVEQKIYLLIARAYIAQFFPLHLYQETKVRIQCAGHEFTATSKITLKPGWLVLYKNDKDNDELQQEELSTLDLSSLQSAMQGVCEVGRCEEQETKPPALYSMSTLLKDLTRTAKYIKDPGIRKLLQEKDKGKEGEHGGIGTPATRSSIIEGLFERGFLEEKGKKVISTPMGRQFFEALPEQATQPDMTALWHAQQKEIMAGNLTIEQFIQGVVDYIQNEIGRVKQSGLPIKVDAPSCPSCKQGVLMRRKGKKGHFWGCSAYPECKAIFSDKGGKPDFTPRKTAPISQEHLCKECGKGLIRRPTKKKGRYFWGCSGFPNCKTTYFDQAGKPDFNSVSKKEAS